MAHILKVNCIGVYTIRFGISVLRFGGIIMRKCFLGLLAVSLLCLCSFSFPSQGVITDNSNCKSFAVKDGDSVCTVAWPPNVTWTPDPPLSGSLSNRMQTDWTATTQCDDPTYQHISYYIINSTVYYCNNSSPYWCDGLDTCILDAGQWPQSTSISYSSKVRCTNCSRESSWYTEYHYFH